MNVANCTPKVENQQWIAYEENGQVYVDVVYATSLQDGIAHAQELFDDTSLFKTWEGVPTGERIVVRAAVGNELPWNLGPWIIAEKDGIVAIRRSDGLSLPSALADMALLYEGYSIRLATPVEAEAAARSMRLEEDEQDAMEFERGFNEAKESRESGLFD